MTVLRRLGPIDRGPGGQAAEAAPACRDDAAAARRGADCCTWTSRLRRGSTPPFQLTAQAQVDPELQETWSMRCCAGLARAAAAGLDPEANAPGWLYARWSASYRRGRRAAIAAMIPRSRPPTCRSAIRADAERAGRGARGGTLDGGSSAHRPRRRRRRLGRLRRGSWSVRTPPRRSPRGCSRSAPAKPRSIFARRPAARRCDCAASGAKVTALDRSAVALRRVSQSLGAHRA